MGSPESLIQVGAASRPLPGESANGDAWTVQWSDKWCRVAVIDGLGHGPEAADVAQRAVACLEARPDLVPEEALRACHAALSGTRGAAIAVVQLDIRATRLAYAGVGNVEAQLLRGGRTERLISYRGIVGTVLPTIRTFAYDLATPWTLVLHTDGVRARFDLDAVMAEMPGTPQPVAERLLAEWARPTDDATAVVLAAAAVAS